MDRRSLITGLISFVVAPAVVRASSLMPVKVMEAYEPFYFTGFYSLFPWKDGDYLPDIAMTIFSDRVWVVEKQTVYYSAKL